MRVIGSLYILEEDDPESRLRHAGFKQGLKELGWIEGGNARIEARWAHGDDDRLRELAAALLALTPVSRQPVPYRLCSCRPWTRLGIVDSMARPAATPPACAFE
jgi:hypothetical protein